MMIEGVSVSTSHVGKGSLSFCMHILEPTVIYDCHVSVVKLTLN